MLLQPGPNKSALLIRLMSSILARMHTAWLAGQAADADPFVVEAPGLPQG